MENNETTIAIVSQASESPAGYDALQRGAAVRLMPERTIIRVVGDDRVSFLHGMCSNDIKNARPGSIVPALFLTEHAHVIADFFAWIAEDSILLDIDRDLWTRAHEHLERLLVADDVEFEEQTDLVAIDIEGPRVAEAINAVVGGFVPPETWRWIRASDVSIANLPRFGTAAYTILVDRQRASAALASIEAMGVEFRQVDAATMDIVRVENGIAKVGVDTAEKTIALEARLQRAISFDKGCYVGQETIERATARGGLKKKLFGLRFDGDRAPAAAASVRLDGKEVGRVTSVAVSPRLGAIGLAILSHNAWAEGTGVIVADSAGEVAARICDIPFR